MSIEHVKLFDFFLGGLFFHQVVLAEKINPTSGQGSGGMRLYAA